MPILEYILDRFLQFICWEFLEAIINRLSTFLTEIVVKLNIVSKNKTNQISFSNLDVLHKSENYLVLNKPADLLINSNDPKKETVQTLLRKQLPELKNAKLTHEFYFAHRLDFSTSGILCLPLNKTACSAICRSFEDQKCQKFYVALVNGHIEEDSMTINFAIGDDDRFKNCSKKMCTTLQSDFCINPRKSSTNLYVLARAYMNELPITKVLLMPISGRRHQLRVHCAEIGHPIFGDYTYGSAADKKLNRMFLHAIRLVVPNDIESLQIETEDPFDETNLNSYRLDKSSCSVSLKSGYGFLLNSLENK